jgi:hypothetical protein
MAGLVPAIHVVEIQNTIRVAATPLWSAANV